MSAPRKVLSDAEIEHFITYGFVHLKACFPRSEGQALVASAFERMQIDPHDPRTWKESKPKCEATTVLDASEFAPKAYGAICDLVGGEERLQRPVMWNDGFIVNLNWKADRWAPPSPASEGWHIDGGFFRHFLDSPEQAVLTLVIWSDIGPRMGGTFFAPDSIAPVSRYLSAHPEGIDTHMPSHELIRECTDFREATGEVGDVILLHPFMLHSPAPNPSGVARVISNPVEHLVAPMCFDRPDAADYSPTERAVLRALKAERHSFQPTRERRRTPSRKPEQFKLLEESRARRARAS
ncbi:MAG: hypothetical protein HS116_07960 [Planctomycetes bacterium]|nr:hypothetical protein [Planctomycetota bacterium]